MAKKPGKAAGGVVTSSKTGGGKQKGVPTTAKSKAPPAQQKGRVRSNRSV